MDIEDVIRAAGGPKKVGAAIQRSHSAVCKWRRVPPIHVITVARLANLDPHVIRPDIFPQPRHNFGTAAA
ncbi:helix-turn-helix domain-containing protein [Gluconobacter kondonii]|nr:YdaS family helix-turn-helix protein [Gluconobacter kondonii]MBS1056645.1 helix-turn-helix domain-containing protein [Gluconobacter kondonii]MBS1082495.1 helix-turn-helix domain-containing protein [Gluconobacter kondonii]MCP1235950.1 helix-turn-helix domain-containing protein [Gluconobacter kondonii]